MSGQTAPFRLGRQQIGQLDEAVRLYDAGRLEQSMRLARRVLAQGAECDSACFLLALCNEKAGKYPEAIEHCRAAARHAPRHRDYRRKLASLLLGAGELDEAEDLYGALCKEDNSDISTLYGLASLYRKKGDAVSEFAHLCRLKRLNALAGKDQHWIVDSLSRIPGVPDYPGLEEDLSDFLDYPNINPDKLSRNISRFLCNKYELEAQNPALELTDLLNDRLFDKALRSLVLISAPIEALLTNLRASLLTEAASSQSLSNRLISLVEAIGLQNHLNEYVHFVSAREHEILELFTRLLRSQIAAGGWSPARSEVPLLCLSMYGRIHDLPEREALLGHPSHQWPDSLKTLAECTLFGIEREVEAAGDIPDLTPVEDETSRTVRAQYESNPYPRWSRPERHPPQTYDRYMSAILPGYTPPKALRGKNIEVLVAGCGTGQQPIDFAVRFEVGSILAVDISRRSLAYAKLKAGECGVGTVDFYHGDILELGRLDRRFDLIMCSGVLHHMADPLAGWRVLRDLLTPNGVLRIDLYSRIAREDINRQREIIAQLGMEPTPDNIRRYRQALMEREPDSSILERLDFWNMSMCRDLLFHCQEHQFSWPEIGDCCDRLDMTFIGVHANKLIYQAYRAAFPNDGRCLDLDNWHRLELNDPRLFRGMYAFWCERKRHEK
ncbi:MAG TPA: methyltransferase domain-containing protein [Sedimenticola sp.]|nr:methyltransferase domain-containing protein [Sedimenticola sp.]